MWGGYYIGIVPVARRFTAAASGICCLIATKVALKFFKVC